jgi:hypothetical protein
MQWARFAFKWIRYKIRVGFGQLYNLAGIPGLMRECEYEAGITDARITVRVRDLFTIINVNGLDIYFHRLTGTIDGVGSMSGCTTASALESAAAHDPCEEEPHQV